MKLRIPVPTSFTSLFTTAFVLWFGSYAFRYFWPKPLYSYLLLLVFLVIAMLLRTTRSGGLPGTGDWCFRAFLMWLGAYLLYCILEFMAMTQDSEIVQNLITQSEAVFLLAAFGVLIVNYERPQRIMRLMALLAILAVIIGFYGFLAPSASDTTTGRAAGFYGNPNLAGLFIPMAMVAGIPVVPRRWRLGYTLICVLGVLITFSREAFLLCGLAVVGLGWQGVFSGPRSRIIFAGLAIVFAAGAAVMLFAGGLASVVQGSPLQHYLTSNTAARLGIGASVLSGNSASERELLVKESLHSAVSAPWLGHGLGYTKVWSVGIRPHNMYMLFLVEGGVLGLALYLALMALLWYASVGVGRLLSFQFMVVGMFSHNLLEQPATLLVIAFIVAHGAMNRPKENQHLYRPASVHA